MTQIISWELSCILFLIHNSTTILPLDIICSVLPKLFLNHKQAEIPTHIHSLSIAKKALGTNNVEKKVPLV